MVEKGGWDLSPGGLPHLGGHRLGVGGEEEAGGERVPSSSDTNVLEVAKYAAQHLTYGQECDAPGATVGVAFHLPDSS